MLVESMKEPHFIKSSYQQDTDLWLCFTHGPETPEMRVLVPLFLYDRHRTPETDFIWKDGFSFVRHYIIGLSNSYEAIRPSIDNDPYHYYPSGDLGNWVRRLDMERFNKWLNHITDGR